MSAMLADVFKIISADDWRAAQLAGVYGGSADDARDGFIHLSTAEQVAGTLARHYAGRCDLVIAAFAVDRLGPKLVFEASRGGALFPHLYAPLPMTAVLRHTRLASDAHGNPICDEAWLQC